MQGRNGCFKEMLTKNSAAVEKRASNPLRESASGKFIHLMADQDKTKESSCEAWAVDDEREGFLFHGYDKLLPAVTIREVTSLPLEIRTFPGCNLTTGNKREMNQRTGR